MFCSLCRRGARVCSYATDNAVIRITTTVVVSQDAYVTDDLNNLLESRE